MAPYTGSKAFTGQGCVFEVGSMGSPVVFTEVGEIKSIDIGGAKADFVDVTNMQSTGSYREFIPTLLDAGEFTLSGNLSPGDAGQQALHVAFGAKAIVPCVIRYPPASIVTLGNSTPGFYSFNAFVSEEPQGNLDVAKEATFSAKLKISGPKVFTPEGV